ncbi:hypothetical protein SNE40_016248 [Patella caerulea]|uniref:Integral membrane protein 2 n=1 Tax=Patella caerulea TaxID=87958 RepID=A0AAN8P7X6_PATCE
MHQKKVLAMSPPAMNLQSKPEDTERTFAKRSTHRVCIVATSVVVALLIIAATTFGAIAYNHHLFSKEEYKASALADGYNIPENIHVDYHKELIYVSNKQVGPIDALNALHNYDRKLLAFYDLTTNQCYLDRLDQTFDEGLKFWSSHAGKNRILPKVRFDYTPEPINQDVLRKFAGAEIADHCRNVTSHWMINIRPYTTEKRQRRAVIPVVPCARLFSA